MQKLKVQDVDEWVHAEGMSSAEACGCDRHKFENRVGACIECMEGIRCEGMGEVQVLPGYAWSVLGEQVFLCAGNTDRCPGTANGTVVALLSNGPCAEGRDTKSIACSLCEDGKSAQNDGGCGECTRSDLLPMVVVCSLLPICLVAVYCRVDREDRSKQNLTGVMLALVFGQQMTQIQNFSVISLLDIGWTNPVRTIIRFTRLFIFDIEILKPSCMVPLSPAGSYIARVTMALFAIPLIVVIHCFVVVFLHRARFKESMPSLVGALGTVLLALNVSIMTSLLAPFQCFTHPSQLRSVIAYPSVLCWDDTSEHNTMVIVSLVSLMLPFTFVAICIWAAHRFKERMRRGDVTFLRSFCFLFFRFRAEAFWYGPFNLIRNLLVAVVPALRKPIDQVMLLQMLFLLSMCVVINFRPWRIDLANLLDVAMHWSLLTVVTLGLCFVPEYDLHIVSTAAAVVLVAGACVMPLALARLARNAYLKRRKPFHFFICHHKAGAGAFARLLKMSLSSTPGLHGRVFIDSDDLRDLDKLFDYVGFHSEVVVLLESDCVLRRPWCAGELTKAHLHDVKLLRVMWPGVVGVEDEFIDSYKFYVPDVMQLCAHGISVSMVQDALRWVRERPAISTSCSVSGVFMHELSVVIMKVPAQATEVDPRDAQRFDAERPELVILCDGSSWESAATAIILRELVLPLVSHDPAKVPLVLAKDAIMPSSALEIVFVCTNGVFQQAYVLQSLLIAGRSGCSSVPILSDDKFRFPTREYLEEIRSSIASLCDEAEECLQLIIDIFTEIAVVFQPAHYSSTEAILVTKAEEVAARIFRPEKRRLAIGRPKQRSNGGCSIVSSCFTSFTSPLEAHPSGLYAPFGSEENINTDDACRLGGKTQDCLIEDDDPETFELITAQWRKDFSLDLVGRQDQSSFERWACARISAADCRAAAAESRIAELELSVGQLELPVKPTDAFPTSPDISPEQLKEVGQLEGALPVKPADAIPASPDLSLEHPKEVEEVPTPSTEGVLCQMCTWL